MCHMSMAYELADNGMNEFQQYGGSTPEGFQMENFCFCVCFLEKDMKRKRKDRITSNTFSFNVCMWRRGMGDF